MIFKSKTASTKEGEMRIKRKFVFLKELSRVTVFFQFVYVKQMFFIESMEKSFLLASYGKDFAYWQDLYFCDKEGNPL